MKTFLLGLLVGAGTMAGVYLLVPQQSRLGAVPSNGDMIGIYNATELQLRDGYGSALAVDEYGRLVTTTTLP